MTQNAKDGCITESPDFQIFRGSIPPDPPRSLSIYYSFCGKSSTFISLVAAGYCCCLMTILSLDFQNSIICKKRTFRVQPYFLRVQESETLKFVTPRFRDSCKICQGPKFFKDHSTIHSVTTELNEFCSTCISGSNSSKGPNKVDIGISLYFYFVAQNLHL